MLVDHEDQEVNVWVTPDQGGHDERRKFVRLNGPSVPFPTTPNVAEGVSWTSRSGVKKQGVQQGPKGTACSEWTIMIEETLGFETHYATSVTRRSRAVQESSGFVALIEKRRPSRLMGGNGFITIGWSCILSGGEPRAAVDARTF